MAPRKRKVAEDGGEAQKARSKFPRKTEEIQPRNTRAMSMDASRKAVLNTTELLEHILLSLPATKIFGVQRVCKRFRDVIASSTDIQKKLFLKPSGSLAQKWKVELPEGQDWDGFYDMSVMLEDLRFEICSDTEAELDTQSGLNKGMAFMTPVKLNPLLQCRESGETSLLLDAIATRGTMSTLNIATGARVTSSDQSWRNMLVTDPPIAKISLYLMLGYPERHGRKECSYGFSVEGKQCLTLGSLVDHALDSTCHYRDDPTVPATLRAQIGKRESESRRFVQFAQKCRTTLRRHHAVCPSDEERRTVELASKK